MSAPNPSLRKAMTMRYGVALYMSSVLGSGILVLPGLAAQIAGPASLVAWVALSIISYPLAYTFASLSARRPESGGVYSFARESLGPGAASAVGWLFILWYVTGAPVVTVIAASYLAYAFPLTRTEIFLIAGLLTLGAFLVNYRGIVVSSRVQLAVIVAILGLLITAVVASAPSVNPTNFTPFFPNGYVPIGVSAALIFWSYLGYENVSNVAEEFKNPEEDFHRSILFSVIVIGLLYISVAVATVGTRAYAAAGSIAPFAVMLSNALGIYGAVGTAILAVIIIFGTMNAYTTGISRVIYATAKDRGLPRLLDRINIKTQVPDRSLMLLLGLSWITLLLFYVFNVDLETELLIPSGAAILVYIIGSSSGIKLLKVRGVKRLFPWISLAISIIMVFFVRLPILIGLSFALLGFVYRRRSSQPSPATLEPRIKAPAQG
ncbi:MAG TPA: amino acid permease [Candidatus Limnocylindrales bacterium]|nr:amino acid permease [Candidatus Limnocylindrales bacterium]